MSSFLFWNCHVPLDGYRGHQKIEEKAPVIFLLPSEGLRNPIGPKETLNDKKVGWDTARSKSQIGLAEEEIRVIVVRLYEVISQNPLYGVTWIARAMSIVKEECARIEMISRIGITV